MSNTPVHNFVLLSVPFNVFQILVVMNDSYKDNNINITFKNIENCKLKLCNHHKRNGTAIGTKY